MAIVMTNRPTHEADLNLRHHGLVMQKLASGKNAKKKNSITKKPEPFSSKIVAAKIRMSPHYRAYMAQRQNQRYERPVIDFDNYYRVQVYYPEKIWNRASGARARYEAARLLAAKKAAKSGYR